MEGLNEQLKQVSQTDPNFFSLVPNGYTRVVYFTFNEQMKTDLCLSVINVETVQPADKQIS